MLKANPPNPNSGVEPDGLKSQAHEGVPGVGLIVVERSVPAGKDHRVERPTGSAKHVVSVGLSNADQVRMVRSSGGFEGQPSPGSFYTCPREDPMVCEWTSHRPTATMHLSPSDEQWRSIAESFGVDAEHVAPVAGFHEADPVVSRIARLARSELKGVGTGSTLYFDTLGYGLVAHLFQQNLLTHQGLTARPVGRLDADRLTRAMEYMREHLGQPMRLAQIASAVQMSPFHFARCFRATTGRPPHQFLLEVRVERAKEMLAVAGAARDQAGSGSGLGIAEIALACGFSDQAHFTRQFKQRTGVTPGQYLRSVG